MRILSSKYFLILLTLCLFGFVLSLTIEFPKFRKVNSFDLNSSENGVINADLNIETQNDNWFSYSGKELECEVYYKDKLIAMGKNPSKFILDRNSINNTDLNIDFYLDSLKTDLRDFLMKDSVVFDVKISGKFSFLGIRTGTTINSTISTSGMVDRMIEDIMTDDGFKLEKLKIKEILPRTTTFDCAFLFKNELPFRLTLSKIVTTLFAEESCKTKISEWSFDVNKDFGIQQEAIVEGEVNVNNVNTAFTGLPKLFSGKMDYYMKGFALVKIQGREIKIPIRQQVIIDPVQRDVIIVVNYE